MHACSDASQVVVVAHKFNIGKIKVTNKILKDSGSCTLKQNLGHGDEVSNKATEDEKTFKL